MWKDLVPIFLNITSHVNETHFEFHAGILLELIFGHTLPKRRTSQMQVNEKHGLMALIFRFHTFIWEHVNDD